jgi:hypothetical protein
VIGRPHNDRACLGAVTDQVADLVEREDEALMDVARQHPSTRSLIRWIRSLPQRDDAGEPGDGPKVEVCRPPQRLRLPAPDPNCVERAALYLGVAELLEPEPVRRLATVETPGGLHTFPTEDDKPVILDPTTSRNALQAGLFHDRRSRNAGAKVAVTPAQAIDWLATLASEPAQLLERGEERLERGRRAMQALVLNGTPLCIGQLKDVAFVLALANREARYYGPPGRRIVRTTARALDELDQLGQRNALGIGPSGLTIGRYRVRPDMDVISAIGRVTGRLGYRVGVEALRTKLAAVGIDTPVLETVERELKREDLSLGALGAPSPMAGSLGALAPEVLAGRWIARKL